MQHLHTDYERELVPLFVKVLGDMRFSRSKLDEDAVERIKVIPNKMFPLPDQQRDLSRIERPVMEIISIRNSHTPAVATEGFDGVRTHEYSNIAADCSSGNMKFKCQIVVCIMPSMAQYLQQLLPPFTWTHALTPLRCSWGDAKKLMGRLLSHSSKFVEEILDTWFFALHYLRKSECDGVSDFRGGPRHRRKQAYFDLNRQNKPPESLLYSLAVCRRTGHPAQ